MRFSRNACIQEWFDFWKFVEDIGNKPTGHYTMYRLDAKRPWEPGNWYWKPWQKRDVNDKRTVLVRDYYARMRAANPDYFRDRDLRRHFGITIVWYSEQLARQHGVCAICKQPETKSIRGKLLQLAVDHDHQTGHVRGLLCMKCNRALGLLDHDPTRIEAAMKYLASPPVEAGFRGALLTHGTSRAGSVKAENN